MYSVLVDISDLMFRVAGCILLDATIIEIIGSRAEPTSWRLLAVGRRSSGTFLSFSDCYIGIHDGYDERCWAVRVFSS